MAHTLGLKLAAGDPELLHILTPAHAERHCWVITPVTQQITHFAA